ncbi:MAG: hypothetical protein ACRC6U_10040 [Fusobacteriaceae bacterium]
MKIVDIDLDDDTQVFLHLADGSNVAVNLRRNYEDQVEVTVYTSNVRGMSRVDPAINMVNSNTLGIEIRRKIGESKIINK